MKLIDIFEMTWRSGSNFDSMPFPEFEKFHLTHEGKMEHGYDVYSFPWRDTVIYGVKIDDEFATFSQLKMIKIPTVGDVLESLNSKTKSKYSNNLLSYKLRFFLNKHLGKSILLGNIHSIATENVLNKISHLFNLKMLNIKTGESRDWTPELYRELTSNKEPTDWQVLLKGIDKPFNQTESLDWNLESRHLWTYGDYFGNLS